MRKSSLHWFRRDFRVRDNRGLLAAAEGVESVVGLFVIDPRWFGGKTGKIGAHQATFWLESLRDLKQALAERNIALVVRTGSDPVKVVMAVAKETGAELVTFNKEYEPAQVAMDERLEETGRAVGMRVEGFKDAAVFEEEEVMTGGGTVYSVFTPYKNAYLKKLSGTVEVGDLVPLMGVMKKVKSEGVPTAEQLGFAAVTTHVAPGEKAGAKLLAGFCANGLKGYQATRNFPALGLAGKSTSLLSAHLNAGTVSMRQAMQAALEHRAAAGVGAETWISELVWRDFYRMILFHYPETVSKAFQKKYVGVTWKNEPAMIEAWSEGRTGYPLVDAAMRQVRATGFMHNRLRMIAAMFLTKDLDVHWVVGERLFMQWLADYDQACNVGGWQWAASTGTDAAPYFRVMNPVLQSERYDAQGEFIRAYVPELKGVPAKYLHAPWEMPAAVQAECSCVIGRDYPGPVVDHAEAKVEAVRKFRERG